MSENDVADFLVALRSRRRRAPAAGGVVGGTGGGGRAGLPPVRRAGGAHREPIPARDVRPPTLPQRLPKAITVGEVEAILDAAGAEGTPRALRDRALLEVLYGTGARISRRSASTSTTSTVETASVLLRGKGSKERMVPGRAAGPSRRSRPTSSAVARPWPRTGRGGPALFLNHRGGRLTRQSAWTVLAAAVDRSGVTADVSPHTLRHTFATHLLDGGADVRVVQELLGHASVTTTQIYTLVTVDRLREVYATAHPRARG